LNNRSRHYKNVRVHTLTIVVLRNEELVAAAEKKADGERKRADEERKGRITAEKKADEERKRADEERKGRITAEDRAYELQLVLFRMQQEHRKPSIWEKIKKLFCRRQ
jgi:hypothetical protein